MRRKIITFRISDDESDRLNAAIERGEAADASSYIRMLINRDTNHYATSKDLEELRSQIKALEDSVSELEKRIK
ncbi:hypothetical protein ACEF09_10705 [Streptococcus suis]